MKLNLKLSQVQIYLCSQSCNNAITHQNTEYGRNYGLSEIKTIEQFQAQIPILPYSSYEPYIERIANGETNILTADPVVYLSHTSGSTGKQKFIPVTRRFQNSLR